LPFFAGPLFVVGYFGIFNHRSHLSIEIFLALGKCHFSGS